MQNENINFVHVFLSIEWHNLLELPSDLFSALKNQQHDVTALIPSFSQPARWFCWEWPQDGGQLTERNILVTIGAF